MGYTRLYKQHTFYLQVSENGGWPLMYGGQVTPTQVIIDPVMSCGKITFALSIVYFQGLCQFIGWGMEITNDIVDVMR